MSEQKRSIHERLALQLFHRDKYIEESNNAFIAVHPATGVKGKLMHWGFAIMLWLRHTPKAALREFCVHVFHDPNATQEQYREYVKAHPAKTIFGKIRNWCVALSMYRTWKKATKLNLTVNRNNEPQNHCKPLNNYHPVSESSVSCAGAIPHGISPLHLAAWLNQFDVISFDIFDTLISRPFSQPTDLFNLLEARMGRAFSAIRTSSEAEARKIALEKTGTREVTIDEIYTLFARHSGMDKEKCMEMELAAEREFCYANPFMKKLFDVLKANGKKIIIVSDMYIPGEQMAQLLASCGYSGYDKLYVSCDYHVSKSQGGLFEVVKKDYPDMKIAHIGDNPHADWAGAEAAGMTPVKYHNAQLEGSRFRSPGMSPLIGSAYAGIVNNTMHNGMKHYDPAYEFGFIYGGLYVTGFCSWLKQKMEEHGIEKLLFLARDGDIYHKVFERMYPDTETEYVYWSRMAAMRYCTAENRYEFISRMVINKAKDVLPASIHSVLDSYRLSNLLPYIKEAGLDPDELLTPQNSETVAAVFEDHWDEINASYIEERSAYAEILRAQIGSARTVGIVDVGWAGSGPLCLNGFIHRELGEEYTTYGFMAGAATALYAPTEGVMLKGHLETYMFSLMDNTDLYWVQHKSNRSTNCMTFEMFTQTTHSSFRGVKPDGTLDFVIPEVENYEQIRRIHQGIMDFNRIWCKTFKNDDFMLNISGRDAYIPFGGFISDMRLLKREFKNFVVVRNVGMDEINASFATMSDQLKSVNL